MTKIEYLTIAEVVTEIVTLRARVKELEAYEPIIIDPDLSKCEVVEVEFACTDCGGDGMHKLHCPSLVYDRFVNSLDNDQLAFTLSEFETWFNGTCYCNVDGLFNKVLAKSVSINARKYVK